MLAVQTANAGNDCQNNLHRFRTLLLNADYRPLSTTPLSILTWREAIEIVYKDRAQVVEEWEGPVIRSQRTAIPVPKVIIANEYIKVNRARTPALSRLNCALRDRFRCGYCGNGFRLKDLTFDHVIPRSKGGKSTWDNLLMACGPCNRAKGNSPANYDGVRGEVRKGNFVPLTRPYQPTMDELYKIGLQFIPPELGRIFGGYLPLPQVATERSDLPDLTDYSEGPWDPHSYWTGELEP